MPASIRATTEAERIAICNDNFAEWGYGLSASQYLARENLLDAHAWSRLGKTTWILVDDDSAPTPLSSCETYSVASSHGRVWEIASVFTAPPLRKQGHASALLRALIQRAAEQRVAGLVLFSDIDPAFYKRIGFGVQAPSANDVVWPAETGFSLLSHMQQPRVVWLTSLDELALPQRTAPPSDFFIMPTREQLQWHIDAAEFYGSLRDGRSSAHPIYHGATVSSISSVGVTSSASIVWCPDKTGSELTILFIDAGVEEDVRALIGAAREYAGAAGMQAVRAWQIPTLGSAAAAMGGKVVPRKGAHPMLCLCSEGGADSSAASDDDTTVLRWEDCQRGVWV